MEKSTRARPSLPPGHWSLQDAKARFSELVRRVRGEGPQHVCVHGRDEVVVISVEEYRRMRGAPSGSLLVEAFRSSPHRDVDIAPSPRPMPIRDVEL